MTSGPETKLVEKMREAATKKYGKRIQQIKQHGSAYSRAGVSDLLVCLDGVFIAVEVKAPESYPVKGQPSIEKALEKGPTVNQKSFIRKVDKAGGIGAVVASVEQYMEVLHNAIAYHEYRTYETGARYAKDYPHTTKKEK